MFRCLATKPKKTIHKFVLMHSNHNAEHDKTHLKSIVEIIGLKIGFFSRIFYHETVRNISVLLNFQRNVVPIIRSISI
jgi:hypothetical protein